MTCSGDRFLSTLRFFGFGGGPPRPPCARPRTAKPVVSVTTPTERSAVRPKVKQRFPISCFSERTLYNKKPPSAGKGAGLIRPSDRRHVSSALAAALHHDFELDPLAFAEG